MSVRRRCLFIGGPLDGQRRTVDPLRSWRAPGESPESDDIVTYTPHRVVITVFLAPDTPTDDATLARIADAL